MAQVTSTTKLSSISIVVHRTRITLAYGMGYHTYGMGHHTYGMGHHTYGRGITLTTWGITLFI